MSEKFRTLPAILVSLAFPSLAIVNLELWPVQARHQPGQIAEVGLYAVSDSDVQQPFGGAQVILSRDPAHLELGASNRNFNNGPYTWLVSRFFADAAADGLNNTWADGNAFYPANAPTQPPALATPSGLLVTTFRHNALADASATLVGMPASFGQQTETGLLTPGDLDLAPPPEWGRLALEFEQPACGFTIGDTFRVRLLVSQLLEPINGVQALVEYPPAALTYVGAIPGDALGSPWDGAIEIINHADGGVVTYSAFLPAGSSALDAVVADLVFQYLPAAPPAAFSLQVVPVDAPLFTRLTVGSTGRAVIPNLAQAIRASSAGDFDLDGAIGLADFDGAALCLQGPGNATCCAECCRLDFDGDSDVDLSDFAELQRAFAPQP